MVKPLVPINSDWAQSQAVLEVIGFSTDIKGSDYYGYYQGLLMLFLALHWETMKVTGNIITRRIFL